MKRSYIIFGALSAVAVAGGITAAALLGSGSSGGSSSVPEFIPLSTTSASRSDEEPLPQTTASSSGSPTPGSTAPADTGSTTSDSTTSTAPLTLTEPPEDTSSPEETSVPVTTSTTPAAATTAASTSTSAVSTGSTATSASTSAEPEQAQENVLVTSGDPLHHIRFEFGKSTVKFSGVYTGDKLTDLSLYKPKRQSAVLTLQGDSFTGSLDVSGLEPGYYIMIARLASNEGMYYVFEMTSDGSRAVPADVLPAASNLAFVDAPMELSESGVLHQVTVSDDMQTARELLKEVQKLSDEICAGLTSDYDKVRALCEWVSLNIFYDKDASKNGVTEEEVSLEYVLKNHRSVCFGWSNLFAALCQAQGIDCLNASGSVVTGSRCFAQTSPSDERSHSWNMVVCDGRIVWVDTVWNSSNSYDKGNYFQGNYDMQYFDIDPVLLSHDHRIARLEHRDYYGLLS